MNNLSDDAERPDRAQVRWAFRGAVPGAVGSVALFVFGCNIRQVPASPLAWSGTALLALSLLVIGESVRSRWQRWSHGLAGAGVAALLTLGMLLVMSRLAPEGGYPLVLLAAVYAFLRLGVDAGLLVSATGSVLGSLLGGSNLGAPLLVCLFFVFCSRSAPSRWQILALIAISAVSAAAFVFLEPARLVSLLLVIVVVPWLLHFGSSHPWRWTALASLLAMSWLFSAVSREGAARPATTALASAAGLLLLAVPPARRLAQEPSSTAASATLEPLLAAAVTAVAWAVPLAMEPRRPWVGALLMIPLLGWVSQRLKAPWLWLPILGAAATAVVLFAEAGP